MDRFRRLIGPIAIALVGAVALVGYWMGQQAPPMIDGGAPSASAPVITPRMPGNATTRTTPTPLPTVALPDGGTPLVLPTASPPAPDSDEPLPPLVFARAGQIWRSDGGGAPPVQLTSFAEGISPSHPSLSPDGSQIAFVALIPPPITATLPLPSSRLYLIGRDGGGLRELWAPSEGILWLPSWAPDGAALYMLANGTTTLGGDAGVERLTIMRVDLQSGAPTPVITGALDPSISRDGAHMAYLRFDADGVTMHLEVADLDGQHARRLIDGGTFLGFYAPRFSPDGQQLIVAAIEGPPTDERGFPIDPPTSRSPLGWLAQLLEPPTAEAHGAPWDLWVVNLDGSGLRRLTQLNEDLPMATFSPDGATIALMAYNGIYLMDRDGANIRRIDPRGDHGGLDWLR